MKRLGIFLIAACMALAFAGCSGSEDDGTSSKNTSSVVSSEVSSQEETADSSKIEESEIASIDYDPTASMDVVSETSSMESIDEIIEVLD